MAALEDSVFMVCSTGPARAHLGTAWACGPGLAMTAWHVVEGTETLVLACGTGETAARCIDHSAQYDVALLRFDKESLNVPPLSMNDDGDWQQGDAWHSWGHPLGFPTGFPLDGTVSSPGFSADGRRNLALNCPQGPKPYIRGLSGGPVVDACGTVIGLLTGYPADLAQITLFATRLDDAWAQLHKWRERMPCWPSGGAVSRYLARQEMEWDRPTHRMPFMLRAAPRLSDIFIAPRFRAPHNPRRGGAEPPQGTREAGSLLDILYSDARHLVLRGDPGTGKSVLLRWLASLAGQHWRTRHARAFVPVIVHAARLAAADCRAVMQACLDDPALILPQSASWLLMVDGLDEVVDVHDRRRVVEQLRCNGPGMLAFRGSPVRLVIASRPLAVLDEFASSQAQHFVLQPFTGLQLEAFSNAWFADQAPDRIAQAFMDEVRLSRMEGLAAIPALATMAAVVFERSPNHTLPRRRSDLYDRFIELMLKEREDSAWRSFEDLCLKLDRARDGRALARSLWDMRLELATRLAVEIQEGRTGLGTGDFVLPLVRIAQEAGALPVAQPGSLQADLQWVLMNDLMLSSGLFIGSAAGRLEFFHNTIREALAAKAITAHTPATAALMWPVVRRWSEPRWREIVLIALAHWSELGEAASREVWSLLSPLMDSSRMGLQFTGMAVAEGVRLPEEHEAKVTAALFKRLGAWNPCAELFLEFRSPNPLDVLRLLTRRQHFVALLIREFDENPEKCSVRMWAFLELTLDQAGSAALRRYLDGSPDVALAAATLLARAGEDETAAPGLINALRSKGGERKRKAVDDWRVAEVVAEYCSTAHLHTLLDTQDIAPDTRLAAAVAGWKRYRDETIAVQAAQLLAFCVFDIEREDDVALVRRALDVPGIVRLRPRVQSGLATVLAAMCAPREGAQAREPWVHALYENNNEPASLRAYARAAVLYAEPDTTLDAAAFLHLLHAPDVDEAAVAALLGSLGYARHSDLLASVSAAASLPPARRFAAALAWLAADGGEAPRACIRELLAQLRGMQGWDSCIVSLGRAGQIDLAAGECMHALMSPTSPGSANEIRNLMDMGCSGEIARVIHTKGINPMVMQFAVRCLGQLGDAPRLHDVAQDKVVLAAVRLHAVKALAELGWVQESADQALGIALEINEPPQRSVEELESIALASEIASGSWPPAVLTEMAEATKMHFPVWRNRLAGLLAQPGVSGKDAVGIMQVLGHASGVLEQVLLRCEADPGDGSPLRRLAVFAREEEEFSVALRALGLLCGDSGSAESGSAWALHRCAALIAHSLPSADYETARMYEWVAEQAARIWLGLLRTGVLGGRELLLSLAELLATGQEKFAARRALLDAALKEADAHATPDALWALLAPAAQSLERAGDIAGARKLARIPTDRGMAFDAANADCVALVLLLARCKSIALVKDELRQIALHASLSPATRMEAAAVLAKKIGGQENTDLLQALRLTPQGVA